MKLIMAEEQEKKRNTASGKYWDRAWSLIEGCTPVSEACRNCWLAAVERRFRNVRSVPPDGISTPLVIGQTFNGIVRTREDRLDLPLTVKKPTVWAIWSDLFHSSVSDHFIFQAYTKMHLALRHTFLILTKRPARMAAFIRKYNASAEHIWHGTTVENQDEAEERITHLLQIPGKKFLSIEPLLGPVHLDEYLASPIWEYCESQECGGCESESDPVCEEAKAFVRNNRHIDAVILGGESGPHARPMHPDWVRPIRDQCDIAGVPFYLKQRGEFLTLPEMPKGSLRIEDAMNANTIGGGFVRVGRKNAGRSLDGRTYDELPWKK